MLDTAPPADLATLRKRQGLTQAELGQRIGVSQSDLSKLERRDDVRLSTLRSFAGGLGGRIVLLYCDDRGCARLSVGAEAAPQHERAITPAHLPINARVPPVRSR